MEQKKELTGYPSIDKPWLKYYTDDQIELALPRLTAFKYIEKENANNQNGIAINYFNKKITYGEMFNNIEYTTKAFSSVGVKKGDVVSIVSVTLPETIYSFYALNRIGAISNMIDPRTSIEGMKNYIVEVDSRIIVAIDLIADRILQAIKGTNVEKVIIISPSDSLTLVKKFIYNLKEKKSNNNTILIRWRTFIREGMSIDYKEQEYESSLCCTIVHTGGTTGVPKGVMLSNDNINAAAQQILKSPLPLNRGDVFLNIMPPFIAYGTVLGIHTVGVGGLESVIIPRFDSSEFDSLLLRYKPQCVMGVPTYFEGLMKSKKIKGTDLSFLKVAFVGGDKIKEDAEKEINNFFTKHNCNVRISKGYSMTEASATATFASEKCNKVGSVGSPLAKTVVSVFGESLNDEKKYNEIGNIYISSPTIMLGYYGKNKETSEVIKKDRKDNKWLYTGDLGYVDQDGCVFVMGREKRMIIRYDGFKVFPTAIESIIEKCDEVKECCVVGINDKNYSQGKCPKAYAVLKEGVSSPDILTEKILLMCKKELPEYSQPIEIEYIEKLPLTPIGKVDYINLENRN